MKKEVETRFFVFSQNNSGGYFIKNDDVSSYVIIEATNHKDAQSKAEDIFENYSEYCECCGERWDTDMNYVDSYVGIPDELQIIKCVGMDEAIIYYIDGSKARYDLINKNISEV